MIGTSIGPYQILAELGRGGMGEVYRARDTRLGRDVAIKVLSAGFAKDEDRVRRFTIEAQATGALNHPNILAVYDIGTHDGAPYLVAELLEGETLRARMDEGRIPLTKALDLARQVASGLAAAHAKGITHRDIKPENLFVTTDGRAKILDFGLAKQHGAGFGAPEGTPYVPDTDASTVLGSPTAAGMVLGTVGYMSPEQVRGDAADARSDIFSFGVVLYELLSGQRPFIGDTAVQTMNAILTEDPPEIATTTRALPPALERVVRHCLEKKPDERFQSARDLAFALDALSSTSSTSSGAVAVVEPPRRRFLPVLAAAGAIVAVVLATLAFFQPADMAMDGHRFVPFAFESGGQSDPAWNPDGTVVAYSGAVNPLDPKQVFIRYLDEPVAKQLTDETEDCAVVGWMPGGQRILFRRGSGLFSVASVGGESEPVPFVGDPTFGRNYPIALAPQEDVLAAVRRGDDGLFSVWTSSPVGEPLIRYQPDPFASAETIAGRLLSFSPDGRQMLLSMPGGEGLGVWLVPYPANPAEPPRQVLTDIVEIRGISWMPDNRRVVLSLKLDAVGDYRLWMVDLFSGERHAITDNSSDIREGVVSPDGHRLIASEETGRGTIVQVDVQTADATRLIANERVSEMPAWAADVPVMSYVSERNGVQEIWLHRPGAPEQPLVTASNAPPGEMQFLLGPTPSPDGERVVYTHIARESRGGSATRLWIASTTGGLPVPLTNTSEIELPGSWSPDGKQFAYLRAGSSTTLMVVRTSGQAPPEVLKEDVALHIPVWSPDGKWIKFAVFCGAADPRPECLRPGRSGSREDVLSSPDGQTARLLGALSGAGFAFSRDSKRLYGIRREGALAHLFAVDIETRAQTVIGDMSWDYASSGRFTPSTRFSLTPDGKSLAYGSFQPHTNLWLMEGFAPERGLLSWLGLR